MRDEEGVLLFWHLGDKRRKRTMTGLLPYDDDKEQRTLVCCHGGIIVAVLIAYFSSLQGNLRKVNPVYEMI